jgi:proteasome assembly chaperone (PAC2) family protein
MNTPERWLVAAWPGMGQVATTAAIYLLSKLRMQQMAEFPGRGIFELESIDVNGGLVRAARLPRSRLFLWRNPSGGRDIIVFLGEAQPPTGKLELCERLFEEGRALGVSRFFTFSAITTDMKPSAPSRAFGIASDAVSLDELKRREIAILTEGSISGLNGVALAAAAEAGIPAMGLLGEMPAIAAQLPYPNASAAVLRTFKELANLELDLTELEDYGRSMQDQLSGFYEQIMRALQDASAPSEPGEPGEPPAPPVPPMPPIPPVPGTLEPSNETMLPDEDSERVESLFRRAQNDRTTAFELKKELERLGVFARYEDRFLDLFERGL